MTNPFVDRVASLRWKSYRSTARVATRYDHDVLRRVHVRNLQSGRVELDAEQAHHVRNVLRLGAGDKVEAFDDGGAVATAQITQIEPIVALQVEDVRRQESVIHLTIAAAVPKGDRADWMIEKLSELGCARFIPLATARSVVLPEGRNKRERWMRIATESAKQSRRAGVMQIDELTPLKDIEPQNALYLSTEPTARSIANVATTAGMTLLIGPEGGWTDPEIAFFRENRIAGVMLTDTILRVETAAIAAAVVMTLAASDRST